MFPLLLLLLLAFSCGREEKAAYQRLEGKAQGTTFSIVYRDSLSRDFSGPVDSLFRLIDRSMSVWDTASIISRINRNEPGVRVDEHFTAVFNRAREVSALTGGAFDVTVGPLVKAWGFSYKKGLPLPGPDQVDSLRALVGYERLRLDDGLLIKADPRMEVDFNAIAQGYTVDLIAAFLQRHGLRDYLVEIGGEVRTAGVNEQGKPWQIGIDKPVENAAGRPLQTTVAVSGRALATSGSYRKFVERDGRKYSHAIDPKTGYPITHNLLSVSVLAGDCTSADAFATAFLVMGMEKALETAPAHGLEIYCIYADEAGGLQVRATPGFSR
jgi:thiamine biosynthesis lipoprotein